MSTRPIQCCLRSPKKGQTSVLCPCPGQSCQGLGWGWGKNLDEVEVWVLSLSPPPPPLTDWCYHPHATVCSVCGTLDITCVLLVQYFLIISLLTLFWHMKTFCSLCSTLILQTVLDVILLNKLVCHMQQACARSSGSNFPIFFILSLVLPLWSYH